jgi:acyl-coenzyme A synthetase/AMP-(fatty) acid ligase
MVKVRGHRIEPAEVEAALSEHENVREAAVFVRGEGLDARLVACIVPVREPGPSLLAMKGHSAERLPRYMILDELVVMPSLPRTANGKLDHERLA